MNIHPIRTPADYKATLRDVSLLMERDPDLGTADGDRLDVLVTLVQAYEAKHHSIDPPDPVEAIKFRMEQAGLTVKDLVPYIGPLNRVYEVLAYKRPLSLGMIRRLADGLRIPAEVLIRQSDAVAA
ncbi:type II toxin-antitoxin system HigA family antitoxin [Variovorax sp. UMC13]|uniref:helix-turn-helix domain-containing protein n=1 Tax=Variovorax sp. UMC13 TaxID=1862326 RepID=UPI00160408A0|nr:transcriptional regulator [Variovorax sp. UMC13]MBB1599659.1 transcriptional regulator [Variovorax sp. UMC13]